MLRSLIRAARRALTRAWQPLVRVALEQRWGRRLTIGAGVEVGRGVRLRIADGGTLELGAGIKLQRVRIVVGRGATVRIGRDSVLRGLELTISGAAQLTTGSGFKVNTLYPQGTTEIVIHSGTAVFGDGVYIDGGHYRVLESGRLEIGDHASIGLDSEVRAELSVRIGRYTMVAYRVTIFDTNTHSLDYRERRSEVDHYPAYQRGEVRRAPVEIGDDCWIGLGSAILKGVTIARSIVGLSTTVTAGTYPADSRIVGGVGRVV